VGHLRHSEDERRAAESFGLPQCDAELPQRSPDAFHPGEPHLGSERVAAQAGVVTGRDVRKVRSNSAS
jgi:hypothetical protein